MDDRLLQQLIKEAEKVYPGNETMQQVVLTQAILESGFTHGEGSQLALKYCNLFGIKGKGTAGSITLETKEYIEGEEEIVNQEFQWNDSFEDSFKEHKELMDRERYTSVRRAPTPERAFIELQKDGYATDPHYPEELTEIWKKYIQPEYN